MTVNDHKKKRRSMEGQRPTTKRQTKDEGGERDNGPQQRRAASQVTYHPQINFLSNGPQTDSFLGDGPRTDCCLGNSVPAQDRQHLE